MNLDLANAQNDVTANICLIHRMTGKCYECGELLIVFASVERQAPVVDNAEAPLNFRNSYHDTSVQ